ncbi:MAG: ABC transporter substrate-binding protein [Spirochaetota bacterium]
MKTKIIIAFVISVLLMVPAAMYAGGKAEPEKEAPKPEARPYEGVSLNVGLLARSISDALKPYLDDFYDETGIRVNIEQHAYDSLRDKMMLEFAAKSGYFDIIYLSPGYLGELMENDYILELNPYMEKLDFKREDFLPAAIEISRYGIGEEIWGFPYLADTTVLLYRKDLFEDPQERREFRERFGYDLPIPTLEDPLTTQQFMDLAKFFTRDTNGDGSIDMYGFGYPQTGVAYGNLYIMPWIWTFGEEYFDEDYQVTVDSPKALAAMQYAKELQNYQPPGVLGWDYGDHIPWFYEGRLAMTGGWFHIGLDANDPEKSDVAGKVGYAVVPVHPESGLKTGKAVLGGGSLAITKHSRNPEAAFTYLNWMFGNKERALEWYLNGGSATLKGIYESPEVYAEYPWAEEFFPIANFSLSHIAKQRPTLGVSHSLFEVMSSTWHNVALGRETPEAGLQSAAREMQEIIDRWQQH